LNKKATGDDLNSIGSILSALKNDPRRELKLEQAYEDPALKGILS